MRCYKPDEIDVVFDDERLVADAGLVLPATPGGRAGTCASWSTSMLSQWPQRYLNEWTAGEDRLADRDDVAAGVGDNEVLEPQPGRRYVTGLDVGLTNDRCVGTVCHRDGDRGWTGSSPSHTLHASRDCATAPRRRSRANSRRAASNPEPQLDH